MCCFLVRFQNPFRRERICPQKLTWKDDLSECVTLFETPEQDKGVAQYTEKCSTPDSYLQLLIDATDNVQNAQSVPIYAEKSHWSTTSSETSDAQWTGNPGRHVESTRERYGYPKTKTSKCELTEFCDSTASQLDREEVLLQSVIFHNDTGFDAEFTSRINPTATVHEMINLQSSSDLDPSFYQRAHLRQQRYEGINQGTETREQTSKSNKIARDIELTVARMTKNFHLSSSERKGCYEPEDRCSHDAEESSVDENGYETELLSIRRVENKFMNEVSPGDVTIGVVTDKYRKSHWRCEKVVHFRVIYLK